MTLLVTGLPPNDDMWYCLDVKTDPRPASRHTLGVVMIFKCPTCEQRFTIEAKPINPPLSGASIHGTSILTPNILRSVEEFMKYIGPGRRSNHQLHLAYLEESQFR